MPLTVACPKCQTPLTYAVAHAGRQFRCAKCQQVFTTPPLPAAPAAPPAPVVAAPPPPSPTLSAKTAAPSVTAADVRQAPPPAKPKPKKAVVVEEAVFEDAVEIVEAVRAAPKPRTT